jgi:flagellar motor switch protein FliG
MSSMEIAPIKLKGIDKAAIFLVALGPAVGASILKQLPEEDADRIAKAVAQMERVSPENFELAIAEYQQFATSHTLIVRGGLEYARKMLTEAFGDAEADRLIHRLSNSLKSDLAVFENLRKVDPQRLANFIQDEHPQTIALILCHLDPAQAARLIGALPIELHKEIATRMADLDDISPEIVRNIASVIDLKLRNLGELSREQLGGVRSVANIFNSLDPKTCSELLNALETDNPPLFENIRRFMFVFRDLENLDDVSIKALITKVDRKVLVVALKGANESLRNKFVATQSARGAEMILEDIASTGPVRLKEVDAAQQQVIATAREMEKEGAISLSASGTDQYLD